MDARETEGNSTIMHVGVVCCYIARNVPRSVDIAMWRSAGARMCYGGVCCQKHNNIEREVCLRKLSFDNKVLFLKPYCLWRWKGIEPEECLEELQKACNTRWGYMCW